MPAGDTSPVPGTQDAYCSIYHTLLHAGTMKVQREDVATKLGLLASLKALRGRPRARAACACEVFKLPLRQPLARQPLARVFSGTQMDVTQRARGYGYS